MRPEVRVQLENLHSGRLRSDELELGMLLPPLSTLEGLYCLESGMNLYRFVPVIGGFALANLQIHLTHHKHVFRIRFGLRN